ncbi:plexin-A1-like isoform X6 [Dreissena polymorpha]|uniref:plexin-A1-like isoform X6 n=1 Tax=Dreissena polymorpha TaxID=45954 RepID=UPI0022646885|nr:plexin-A1-like isoform X6 [Dreissena polymorpha]
MIPGGKTILCLLLFECCVFLGGINGQGRILLGDFDTQLGLTGIVALEDGLTLIVAGRNFICSINTSSANVNQTVIQNVTTRPSWTSGQDDITVAMIYSRETERLVTCGNSRDKCDVRNVYNISEIRSEFPFPISHRSTASMILRFASEYYMFVARPITEMEFKTKGCCKDAGVFWYKLNQSLVYMDENAITFKFSENVTVNTTTFIKAVSVDTFRIFFSQQLVINEGKYVSRVAQMCQQTDNVAKDTYVDMPLECGDFRQLEVVEFLRHSKLFVTAFSRGSDAALCLYSFEDIQIKLWENLKLCYQKQLNITHNYFTKDKESCKPTTPINPDRENLTADILMCKPIGTVGTGIIGSKPLRAFPFLEYMDTKITAMAVSESAKTLFMGTHSGKLLKASFSPYGKKLEFEYTVERGNPVRPDMVVSGNFVYVLTENRLAKVPVEMCASYKTCDVCMKSMDQYCGWCILENRCTSVEDCKSPARIAVLGNASRNASSCPHITSVEPPEFSIKHPQELILKLSHELSGSNVTCRFMATENGRQDVLGSVLGSMQVKNGSVKCIFPILDPQLFALEGDSSITVQLLTNVSSLPVMEGNFIVYSCNNFKSCMKCTHKCGWCTLQGRCVQIHDQCILSEPVETTCPRVSNYSVVNDNVTDSSTLTLYLSEQKLYQVRVTGENFVQPRNGADYSCSVLTPADPDTVQLFPATFISSSHISCTINQTTFRPEFHNQSNRLSVTLNSVKLDGLSIEVVFYRCEELTGSNCKQCESLRVYQPYFQCRWCQGHCRHVGVVGQCERPAQCPEPTINKVYPLSSHLNASLCLEIEGVNLPTTYEEANNSLTVGNQSCHFYKNSSYCNSSYVGNRISCRIVFMALKEETANISLHLPGHRRVTFIEPFTLRLPEIYGVQPKFGPISGGTNITIEGKHLLTGRDQHIRLGGNECTRINKYNDTHFFCRTPAISAVGIVTVELIVDMQSVKNMYVNFSYYSDPVISRIHPMKSFISGGRQLTVTGTNLLAVMQPMIVGYWNNGTNEYTVGISKCTRPNFVNISLDGTLVCPSPPLNQSVYQLKSRTRRSLKPDNEISLGFIMDGVGSLLTLHPSIGRILYYPDPTFYPFGVRTPNDTLEIKGDNLMYAATKEDVEVIIGCVPCNVTDMDHFHIRCNLPRLRPLCWKQENSTIQVLVKIGFLERVVGHIEYSVMKPLQTHEHSNDTTVYIGGAAAGIVLFCLVCLLLGVYYFRFQRLQQRRKQDRQSYEYKMDKMEGKFRNQCREEFAALQTAMDDLTSDLEGGSVLFRDYSEYACRTLLTAERSRCLLAPPTILTEKVEREMEQLRNLFRSRQFLLLFIRTLEKQNSFTIQDRSDVATFLMVINHDNMEYITGILTSLLNDLIDKNVSSNSPKLLLRRSESIGEKLLTYWLSIGLYHYLKEQTGSELFNMYKAIKIQVEKGPVDYITACAKYTLSEDRLFTDTDTEDPKQLRLQVSHFDYLENKQKQVEVTVLDCDTITQAKSKMLEILYKNVGYSMRPPVHTTVLEVTMGNGSKLELHDEDQSSLKESGFWFRINTMRHFHVPDGANAFLYFNREDLISSVPRKSAETPEAFIVGSIRKSKPVVRTLSGSKFWHMMKQNQDDDEVRLSTDLFLPRLIQTKGTLQAYIDNFYKAILHVSTEPPIIVKYLFDFLEAAAARHSITDPEVLHTWKCNSLLLRFWVNVIKNPEFVFDIHKPVIVDSCLSVVAQTLMDSCSTSDLKLDSNSPSNKLLFAKDIPRYKKMVANYFIEMKSRQPVSDQELNSFLTQKVSQKYGSKLHQSTALHEMYTFVNRYRDKLCAEMDNEEAEHPGTFHALSSRLQCIYMSMDQLTGAY